MQKMSRINSCCEITNIFNGFWEEKLKQVYVDNSIRSLIKLSGMQTNFTLLKGMQFEWVENKKKNPS